VQKRDWQISRFNGFQFSPKPLKRFVVLSVGYSWPKPGVNETSLSIGTKATNGAA